MGQSSGYREHDRDLTHIYSNEFKKINNYYRKGKRVIKKKQGLESAIKSFVKIFKWNQRLIKIIRN